MNKSMIIGVVAGIGVAMAGGVAGFALLGKQAPEEEQVAVVDPARRAQEPRRRRSESAPQPAAVKEECWDEEVTVAGGPEGPPRDRGHRARRRRGRSDR